MKSNVLITAAGAILVTIGTFLPWVEVLGIGASGWVNGAALPMFIIVLGLLCLGLNFIAKKWGKIVSIILSLLILLVGFAFVASFSESGESAASGLWIIIAGGLVILVGSIAGLIAKKESSPTA